MIKKVKSPIVFLLVLAIMITACSNRQKPENGENDVSIPIEEELQQNQNEDAQGLGESIYGKVKSIVGNEVEIELGELVDWDGNNGDKDEDKKKPSISTIKIDVKENSEGMEDYYAPDPSNPIYGKNGEINLTYTGESMTFIIPGGTDIRNTLGKTATLEEIKKGSILMIKPRLVDGKDASIEALTILK